MGDKTAMIMFIGKNDFWIFLEYVCMSRNSTCIFCIQLPCWAAVEGLGRTEWGQKTSAGRCRAVVRPGSVTALSLGKERQQIIIVIIATIQGDSAFRNWWKYFGNRCFDTYSAFLWKWDTCQENWYLNCFYINLPFYNQNRANVYFRVGNREWFSMWTREHETKCGDHKCVTWCGLTK